MIWEKDRDQDLDCESTLSLPFSHSVHLDHQTYDFHLYQSRREAGME